MAQNTEQIIKALERCCINGEGCYGCPYDDVLSCSSKLCADALALIKELQAHNENLKKENKYLRERLAEEMEHREDMKGK